MSASASGAVRRHLFPRSGALSNKLLSQGQKTRLSPKDRSIAAQSVKEVMSAALRKPDACLPGWTASTAAEVPLFYSCLKNMTSKSLKKQAPLPKISDKLRKIVFTHDSYFTEPQMHLKTSLEAAYPNKSLNTFETAGDACLQHAITDILLERFPHIHTGGITIMRSWLVRNSTLGRLATLYGFLDQLRVSPTNLTSQSVLTSHDMAANILEAFIWAVKKEHGYDKCKLWLDSLFGPLMEPLYKGLGGRRQCEQNTPARPT